MEKSRGRIIPLAMTLVLGISYWLIRCVFFDLHGMKDWPDFLAVLTLLVLAAALIKRKTWLSLAAGFGYPCGFITGFLFNQEGLDPGGGRTSNMWIIWTVCWIIFIIAGIVIERKKAL